MDHVASLVSSMTNDDAHSPVIASPLSSPSSTRFMIIIIIIIIMIIIIIIIIIIIMIIIIIIIIIIISRRRTTSSAKSPVPSIGRQDSLTRINSISINLAVKGIVINIEGMDTDVVDGLRQLDTTPSVDI